MSLDIEEVNGKEENKSNNNDELLLEMRKELEALKKDRGSGSESGGKGSVDLMTELVAGLREKPDSEKYGGEGTYTKIEDIDPNDLLKDGFAFFCHQVGYVIVDDTRQGMAVQTPFKNVINFKYQATRHTGAGNEIKLHNLSSYTSYSKKEVEWLKKHRAFGSVFFVSHMEALNVDTRKAAKLARIMSVLNNTEVHRIIRLASQNDIEPSKDIAMLKLAIANKQVNEEIEKEDEANKIRLKETFIEEQLITKT